MQTPHRTFGKIVSVALPDLGEGTKEATIKEWYVQPGSRVEEFDDLVEVFTDKLVAKIPSTCTGIVKSVNFVEDDVCLVGHMLIDIEVEGEGDDEPAEATQGS
jgi:2-oxoisovalerate dehydrogenase E2 component (dihydrolipoyl transacylase)